MYLLTYWHVILRVYKHQRSNKMFCGFFKWKQVNISWGIEVKEDTFDFHSAVRTNQDLIKPQKGWQSPCTDLGGERRCWAPQRWLIDAVWFHCTSSNSLRYDDTLNIAMGTLGLASSRRKGGCGFCLGTLYTAGLRMSHTDEGSFTAQRTNQLYIGIVSAVKCFTYRRNNQTMESVFMPIAYTYFCNRNTRIHSLYLKLQTPWNLKMNTEILWLAQLFRRKLWGMVPSFSDPMQMN